MNSSIKNNIQNFGFEKFMRSNIAGRLDKSSSDDLG